MTSEEEDYDNWRASAGRPFHGCTSESEDLENFRWDVAHGVGLTHRQNKTFAPVSPRAACTGRQARLRLQTEISYFTFESFIGDVRAYLPSDTLEATKERWLHECERLLAADWGEHPANAYPREVALSAFRLAAPGVALGQDDPSEAYTGPSPFVDLRS